MLKIVIITSVVVTPTGAAMLRAPAHVVFQHCMHSNITPPEHGEIDRVTEMVDQSGEIVIEVSREVDGEMFHEGDSSEDHHERSAHVRSRSQSFQDAIRAVDEAMEKTHHPLLG